MTSPNPIPQKLDENDRTKGTPGRNDPIHTSRDDASSRMSGSDKNNGDRNSSSDKSNDDALSCVLSALEIVVREVPRGAQAQLKPAQDQIRKAREYIGSSAKSPSSSFAEEPFSQPRPVEVVR